MSPLPDQTQENLTSFIDGGLEIADDFLKDAVVHLQLRHFLFAGESLQNALQAMDLVNAISPLWPNASNFGDTKLTSAPPVNASMC